LRCGHVRHRPCGNCLVPPFPFAPVGSPLRAFSFPSGPHSPSFPLPLPGPRPPRVQVAPGRPPPSDAPCPTPCPMPLPLPLPAPRPAHTPYGIRNSEIRNANALAPDDGAGSSGPKMVRYRVESPAHIFPLDTG
jgi:hypothetical protein